MKPSRARSCSYEPGRNIEPGARDPIEGSVIVSTTATTTATTITPTYPIVSSQGLGMRIRPYTCRA